MIPAERLAELKAIAEGATPGPWEASTCSVSNEQFDVCETEDPLDARHIAAFSPPTCLSLLDEIERPRAEEDATYQRWKKDRESLDIIQRDKHRYREALKYIVNHKHVADQPKWGNEFVEVARIALGLCRGENP